MNLDNMSDNEIQVELGIRLKRERLNLNMSQEQLARASGLSRRTITNAEGGSGCTLLTLIAILRALGRLNSLQNFIPEPELSPIQVSKLKGKQRSRATGTRGRSKSQWQWKE